MNETQNESQHQSDPTVSPTAEPTPRSDVRVITSENFDAYVREQLGAEAAGAVNSAVDAPTDAAEDADAAENETDDERTARRKRPIAERLGALTRQRNEERARRADLEARIAQLTARPPEPAAIPAAPPAAAAPTPDPAADPDGPAPRMDQYTDTEQYHNDLVEWRTKRAVRLALEQRDQQDAQNREQQRVNQMVQTFQQRMQQFRADHADFDAVVGASMAPTSEHVRNLIIESDSPGSLVYHFARNPALLAEIQALAPASQARRIGRLEAELATPPAAAQARAGAAASATQRTATPPPAPIEPLRGANGRADLPTTPGGEWTGSYDQYKAARLSGRIK